MSELLKVNPEDIKIGDLIYYKGREVAQITDYSPYQYGKKDRVRLSFNNNAKGVETFFGSRDVNINGLKHLVSNNTIEVKRETINESIEKEIQESLRLAGVQLDEEEDLTQGEEIEDTKEEQEEE